MTHPYRLYYFPGCPYCQLVLRAARRLGARLELVDINREPSARRFLMARRGRQTVPVLEDLSSEPSTLLPESRDIVRFLEERFGGAAEIGATG